MALFAANGLYCMNAAESLGTVAALYRLSFTRGENATSASELELSDISSVVEEGQVGCGMDAEAKRTLMAADDVRIDDAWSRSTAYLLDRYGQRYTGSLSARFYWSQDGRFIVGVDRNPEFPRIRVWETKDYKEVEVTDERLLDANLVGFVANSSAIVTSSKWPLQNGASIEIWDLQTMRQIVHADTIRMDSKLIGRIAAQNPHARGEPTSNGRVVLNADSDGRLNITSVDGSRLGSLTVTSGGEWLVTTPDGLFDGSPAGWRQLSWRESAPSVVEAGELFFNEFYRPGLLARLLTGRAPAAPESVATKDRRQPSLALSGEHSGGGAATITLLVKEAPSTAERSNGSGVRDVRLFRNGSLARIWRGPLSLTDGAARLEATVPVSAGENTFVAYAFNNDDVKSSDAELKIRADVEPRRPVVYLLAIGINQYANHEFDLRYASSDASTFAEAVASAQRATHPDRDIRAIALLDQEATRANILLALARLSGASTGVLPDMAPRQLSGLDRSRPEDTVILYFAGHGMADGDRFFLIPTDIAYQGPRAMVGDHLDDALRNGLSDLDLERALEPLDARYLALIIDACQSGQAIGDDQQRFGPMNSRGLAQLAYEKGMDILAASQAYQAALESADLGQGLLTYSLTKEALSSDLADRKPLDGVVTLEEWFEYAVARVPELQRASIIRARENGRELRFETSRDGHGAELQVPRLFSPRDRGYSPLVIYRTSP